MNTSCQNRPKSGGSPQSAEALRNEIAETEIANRMLADFSAMISHDAQSAVRRIVSSAELLRLLPSVANDSHALAFLHTIVGSTGKIQLLIGDALTMPASHLVERRTAGQETRTPLTRQLAEARA